MSRNENQSRIRIGHGTENFSRLRRIALNLLRSGTTPKAGIKAKSKAAGWSHDYLLKVLGAGSCDCSACGDPLSADHPTAIESGAENGNRSPVKAWGIAWRAGA